MLYFNNNPLNLVSFAGNRVSQVDYKSSPTASPITVWKAKRTLVAGTGDSYALCTALSAEPFYTSTGDSASIVDAITYNGITVAIKESNSYTSGYGYAFSLVYSTNGIGWNYVGSLGYSLINYYSKLMLINGTIYLFCSDRVYSSGSYTYQFNVWTSSDGINWTKSSTNIPATSFNYYTTARFVIYNKADSRFYLFRNITWSCENGSVVTDFSAVYSSADGVNWVTANFDSTNCVQRLPSSGSASVRFQQIFSPTGNGNWYALVQVQLDSEVYAYLLKSDNLLNWTYDSSYNTPTLSNSGQTSRPRIGLLGLLGSADSPLYLSYVEADGRATRFMDVRTKTLVSASFLPSTGLWGYSYEYTPLYAYGYEVPMIVASKDKFIVNIASGSDYVSYSSSSLTASSWDTVRAKPSASSCIYFVSEEG